jgi:hypothetical protein
MWRNWLTPLRRNSATSRYSSCLTASNAGAPLVGVCAPVLATLRERLRQIHAEQPLENRLIAFVADYKGDLDGREPYTCESDALTLDYSVLLALPRLTAFRPKDVILWLNQLEIVNLPAVQRSQIAASVVQNAAGEVEGKPLRVYEQLRSINLHQD